MRLIPRRYRRPAAIVAPILLLSGCDRFASRPVPEQENIKYEFRQDQQGRVLRLNKITGEVTIVSGERSMPAKPPETQGQEPTRKLSARPTAVGASRPAQQPSEVVTTSAPASALATDALSRPTEASTFQTVPVGSIVTLMRPSPLFLVADEKRTPLLTIAKGTGVKVTGTDGGWYQIEYHDPRIGPRVGFVAMRDVAIDHSQTEPLDLSIREPQVHQTDPVDLSVQEPRQQEMKPLDLSIKKPK